MASLLDKDLEQVGDLNITSPSFEDGEPMPDFVGLTNENENPELKIGSVPKRTESLVLVCDDPDAVPVVGFTFDHWLVWDITPETDIIPRGWAPAASQATVGYNDLVEDNYSGPSPPEGYHDYRFKLLALNSTLDLRPESRKAVLDMNITMESEVLAATQIVGQYSSSQGTAF